MHEDYPTIQETIDAASPGDTLVVQEGLYADGRIIVYKPLTLIAEGTVMVDGLHTAVGVFSIISHSVVLEGFIVKNGIGGNILHPNNCKSEGNTVINSLVGILILDSSSNNIVGDNKVLNNSAGILVGTFYPRPYRSKYNALEGNIVKDNSGGIGITYSSYNVVKGNSVTHNNRSIYLIFSDYNTIDENTLTSNLEYASFSFIQITMS